MYNKKTFVIIILIMVIVGTIIFFLINSEKYEKMNITPNGTSLDVPASKTEYRGDVEGIKMWNWNNGVIFSLNSHENNNTIISSYVFNTFNGLIKNADEQIVDGMSCHVLDAEDLLKVNMFNMSNVNINSKFYCVTLSNETTGDNIIICCNDRNTALHMAKSVEFRNVYQNYTDNNIMNASITDITQKYLSNDSVNLRDNISEIKDLITSNV